MWLRSCLSLVDKPHERIRRQYIVACNGDKKSAAHGALQSSNTGQRRRTETTKQRSKNSPLSSATDLLRLPLHDPVVRTNRNTHTNDIHFVNDSAVASSRGSRLERQSRVAQKPAVPPSPPPPNDSLAHALTHNPAAASNQPQPPRTSPTRSRSNGTCTEVRPRDCTTPACAAAVERLCRRPRRGARRP